MRRFRFWGSSLRVGLLLIVLLAIIPSFGLALYEGRDRHEHERREARQTALRLARSVAEEEKDIIEGARQLLTGLAELPQVRQHDSSACGVLFANVLKQFPSYTNVAAAKPNGDVFCSGVPMGGPLNVADRPHFRRALETRELTVSEYLIERVRGRATLGIAYPALDETRAVRAVLHVGLDLGWLSRVLAKPELPSGTTVGVVDRNGIVLARFPDPEKWLGKPMPHPAVMEAIRAQPGEGTIEATGLDGPTRLYAFTPLLSGTSAGSVWVYVGIPTAVIFGESNRVLARHLVGLGLVAVLALAAAWGFGNAYIVRRLHALVRAANRLSAGDLSTRSGLPHDPGSLGRLARAFDGMAESLQQLTGLKKLILDSAGEGICGVDSGDTIVFANLAAARMVGREVEELLGKRLHEVVHHRRADGTPYPWEECPVARTLARGDVQWVSDETFWRKDGTRFPVEYASTPMRDRDAIVGAVIIFDDITERKRAENAVRESSERILDTLESITDGFISVDHEWRVTYVNEHAERLLRKPRETLLGKNLWEEFPETVGSRFFDDCHRAVRNRTSGSSEEFHRPLNRWFEATTYPMRDGLAIYLRDVSQRKQGERDLAWQVSTNGSLAEVARALLTSASLDDVSWLVLEQAKLLTGSALGFVGFIDPKTGFLVCPTLTRDAWDQCRVEGKDVVFREWGGLFGWVLDHRQPLLANNPAEDPRSSGAPPGHLRIHRFLSAPALLDDTVVGQVAVANKSREYREEDLALIERLAALLALSIQHKRADDELEQHREARLQSEKLAGMSELLAGVAHELNNPLSVIVGHAALLRQTARDGPIADRAERIAESANRCARLVRNFLAIARRHPVTREEVSLNDIVREAVELLAYQLRLDNVAVRFDLANDLPLLWADPHQCHQVVVNLVSNAHYALRLTTPPRRLILTTTFHAAEGRVSLEVADSGGGIPPGIQGRLFEPFFTTKPVGEGTGLGLSVCKGLIEGHGGTLRLVRSAPGEGTVFRVELPVTEPAESAATPPETDTSLPQGTGKKILVVDDEPAVSDVIAEMLRADGHTVETAANGVIALEKLRDRNYDLVLSDARMPELDGAGLYREVERRYPGLQRRFVFLTGDILGQETRALIEQTGTPHLHKPFTLEELRGVVQGPSGPFITGEGSGRP